MQPAIFNPGDSSNWLALASDPNTSYPILMQLVGTKRDANVRLLVARHPKADVAILAPLAKDASKEVRLAVVNRPDLPKDVVDILLTDSDKEIRSIAKRLSTAQSGKGISFSNLTQLARGVYEQVQSAVVNRLDSFKNVSNPVLLEVDEQAQRIAMMVRLANSFPPNVLELAESPSTSEGKLEAMLYHPSARVRRTALRNQSTPAAVIARLKGLEAGESLTPDELEYFASVSGYTRSLVAQHPSASESLLEQFMTEPLRVGVAANPNTTENLLERLLNEPDLEPDAPIHALVASNPSLPGHLQKRLQSDERWDVREALARNPIAIRGVLEVLSSDADWEVRETVAQHPSLTPNMIDGLAKDHWDLVRELVAAHPNAAPKTLDELANDQDVDVKLAVAENANTSPETLERLSNHSDMRIRAAVATHPNIPQALLDRLSEDKSTWVQRLVRWRDPEATGEDLTEAARVRKTASRVIAAMSPNTPVAVLERLARDDHPRVRAFVAGNPSCPVEALEVLRSDRRADVQLIAWVLESVGKSEESIKLTSPDARFRRAIAASVRTHSSRWQALSRDHDRGVLMALAANPKTPTYILQGLAHDETLRRTVALNPNAVENVQLEVERLDVAAATAGENTITRMRRLARNARVPVRLALAANPITPEDLLQQLANDKEASVRIRVLQNRNTPLKTLIALTRDSDQKVRLALAKRDPIVYPELLLALASDLDNAILQVIAERSETSTEALEKLSRDDKLHLTLAVNPSSTASILDRIVHSNKPDVWALAASHPNTAGKTLEYMARDLFGAALRSINFSTNFSKSGWLHSFLLGRSKSRAQLYEQISRHPNVTPRLKAHFSMLREAGYLKQNVFLGSQRPTRIQPEFSSVNITLELPPLRSVRPNQESNDETGKD